MSEFKLHAPYQPTGDQPQAIEALVKGFKEGNQFQTLLGVTGSGKTFTMANIIQALQKPTLVIAHNKTLAGQLYGEFKEFFPENAVEYFVSYYDYYQPEAYIPSSDTYIAKDSAVNDEIDKLRLSATASLMEQRSQKINEIVAQLAEKDKQLAAKIREIADLNQNVAQLNKESASQKSTIAEQDQTIHEANYLVGTRKALKEAKVISRQGLFCPPIVSSQAQDADFKSIDVRQTKSIALESKKAKVLSVHPSDSYTLEPGEDGMLVLKIQDENAFWKQTKYLVVMIG